MSRAADALGVARLAAAAAFPPALARAADRPDGGSTPLLLFLVAAATDFFDGRVARRSGKASRHGALLDIGADVAFVLGAATSGAAVGHAAGVGNYALAGLLAGVVALPRSGAARALDLASLLVIALNLAAVLDRLVREVKSLASPCAGRGGR